MNRNAYTNARRFAEDSAQSGTAFCERYREWLKRQSPVMRQGHLAGDKCSSTTRA